MLFYLVEFQCYPTDEREIFLLCDRKYEDWVMAEGGTEGYYHFKELWSGQIEQIILKKDNQINELDIIRIE